jgi:AraC-like DNA-binding protein
VLILAAVPRQLAVQLTRAVGHRFAFRHAAGWQEAVRAIREEAVEIAVVDPGLEGQPRAQEIERLGVLFPSLPLILYTRLVPAVVPVLLQLGRSGIREVLLAGYDDHARRISELLVEEAAGAISRRLINEIQDVLVDCPTELRWAIETVVREPGRLHTVQDLAERARMDRRTCTRWFTKANLPPPSVVLTAIRMVYAHRLLQDPGYTVEDVAKKLGYARPRSFAQHVKQVFGMTPGELRMSLTPEAALDRVREQWFSRQPLRLVRVS